MTNEPINVAEVIRFNYPVFVGDRIRMTTIDQEITCIVTDIQPAGKLDGIDPEIRRRVQDRQIYRP